MSDILSHIAAIGIVPVVVIDRTEDAAPLADALIAGGLPCMEITLRTAAGIAAIHRAARRGDVLVGAGTVLGIDQVEAAADAGARFIVSPGFNPEVADYCIRHGIVHIPGVCTPTDIEAALRAGVHFMKFFPAEACGGMDYLKAISAPYPQVRFMPTGGINPGNLADYLEFPRVFACGGTWIADASLVRGHRFDDITNNAHQAAAIVMARGPSI